MPSAALHVSPVAATQTSTGNAARRKAVALIAVLVAFQALHWFKPSEPYLVDYATSSDGPYGLTVSTILHSVFPVATYSLFGATALVAVIHAGLGHNAGLLTCGVSGAVTVALVLFGRTEKVLVVSEFMWAASFSSLFVVTAALYRLLPRRLYQSASSASSAAMLIGTVASSFVGFFMTYDGTSIDAVRATFVVSLVASSAAVVPLVIGIAMGWLRDCSESQGTKQMDVVASSKESAPATVAWYRGCWIAARHAYTQPLVLLWTISSITVRGPHTLVITNWAELSKTVAPSDSAQKYNGILAGVSYLLAAACVAFPAVPLLARVVRKRGHIVTVALAVMATASCAALALVQNQVQLAVLLTVYNSVAETVLAIAGARIAENLPLAEDHPAFALQFPVAVAGKYIGGILWQLAIQGVADVLKPSARDVFLLYAAGLVVGVVAAIVTATAVATTSRRRRVPDSLGAPLMSSP